MVRYSQNFSCCQSYDKNKRRRCLEIIDIYLWNNLLKIKWVKLLSIRYGTLRHINKQSNHRSKLWSDTHKISDVVKAMIRIRGYVVCRPLIFIYAINGSK